MPRRHPGRSHASSIDSQFSEMEFAAGVDAGADAGAGAGAGASGGGKTLLESGELATPHNPFESVCNCSVSFTY